MTVLFLSSQTDVQVTKIIRHLGSKKCALIDPISMIGTDQSLAYHFNGSGSLSVIVNGQEEVIEAVFWNTRARPDAAMPNSRAAYVGTYRSRLRQFLYDFSVSINAPQFPANIPVVEAAESKILLLKAAKSHGLKVPDFTWNAFGKDASMKCFDYHGRTYRKVLGPPCVVLENGEPITTTNIALEKFDPDFPGAHQPWQFQKVVNFKKQIRCMVVGDKVWSAAWEHSPSGDQWDMRYYQEILGKQISFAEYDLPTNLKGRLVSLVKDLGLSHAAPEFLLAGDGSHYFIDMNPCGEWSCIFETETELQIAEALSSLLK
jgi:hypothetical protein